MICLCINEMYLLVVEFSDDRGLLNAAYSVPLHWKDLYLRQFIIKIINLRLLLSML